jgi:hypothetical protein
MAKRALDELAQIRALLRELVELEKARHGDG